MSGMKILGGNEFTEGVRCESQDTGGRQKIENDVIVQL